MGQFTPCAGIFAFLLAFGKLAAVRKVVNNTSAECYFRLLVEVTRDNGIVHIAVREVHKTVLDGEMRRECAIKR